MAVSPTLLLKMFAAFLTGIVNHDPNHVEFEYRRHFNVPSAWAGQNVVLHFDAVDHSATVSLNGKQLGTHKGGCGTGLPLNREKQECQLTPHTCQLLLLPEYHEVVIQAVSYHLGNSSRSFVLRSVIHIS